MERSRARKPEKRMYEESSEDQDDGLSHLKKQKLPGLTSVIMEALKILGSSMSNKMWENTVDHAKTCNLGGKLHVYYANGANGMSAVFNDIYELRGLIEDEHFYPLESLSHDQKILMDSLMKRGYENWDHIIEYDSKILNSLSIQKNEIRTLTTVISEHNQQYITQPNPHCQIKHDPLPDSQLIEFPFIASIDKIAATPTSDFSTMSASTFGTSSYFQGDFSDDIRLRSSDMLEGPDMQILLKSFSMGSFGNIDENCYSYDIPYEDKLKESERGQGSGRAVVGWIKLKAALRWGIFVRKRAAERRAFLVQLD